MPFRASPSFYKQPFHLVEADHLVETILSVDIIHFMEVVSPLSGSCFSMVEAILFSGDYSL